MLKLWPMHWNPCKSKFYFYAHFEAPLISILYISRLEEINFGDCLLKTRGAIILGEALQDGHLSLEVLNLEANEIGPNGGFAIASAMENKEQLASLNLNSNQVNTF